MGNEPSISVIDQVKQGLRGDGALDVKLVSEYLKEVSQNAVDGIASVDVEVADQLYQVLDPNGQSDVQLTAKRRKPGNPSSSYARAIIGHAAFTIVNNAMASGTVQKKLAVAMAMDRTGLSRAEVFRWVKTFRDIRKNTYAGPISVVFHPQN